MNESPDCLGQLKLVRFVNKLVVNREVQHMGLSNESNIEECQHRLVFTTSHFLFYICAVKLTGGFAETKGLLGHMRVTKKVTLITKNGACLKINRLGDINLIYKNNKSKS